MTTPPGFSTSSQVGRLLATAKQLIEARRFAEAIGLVSKAAAIEPGNAILHTDLGRLYLEAGQPGGAVGPLRRALAIDGRSAIAHYRLGMALQALGDADRAIESLQQAASLQPSLADAHYRLGLLYEGRARTHDALESFRNAARTSEDKVVGKFIQARVHFLEGREDEAEDLLRRVIKRQPQMALARSLLGDILTASGNFEDAAVHYEAALASSPGTGLTHYNLVRCRTITEADEGLIGRIDAVLQHDGLSDYHRSNLLLARGKVFEDLGQYDKAMEAWDAASEARARIVPFNADVFDTLVDTVAGVYTAETFARCVSTASHDRTPVLILGMPRSGTTLCEQILSSHPKLAGAGELGFWDHVSQFALKRRDAGIGDAFVAECAIEYLKTLRRLSPTAERVSDKNPLNFLAIGLIHLVFPRAAIIHCRRNPLDTALSIHQTYFAPWTAMPTGGENLVRYYRAYERLMAHWRAVLPPGRMLEVDYETLTTAPDSEIRRIVDYVGLEWDVACLRPQDNPRIVRTPSRWQVRQPINGKSVERWRRYEPWLGPLAALSAEP